MATTTPARTLLLGVAALRIAYGAALLAAPRRLTERWLGADAQRAGTQVTARALGAREVVLHALVLRAALRDEPVRPLLAGSVAGDLTDIVATWAARRGLPPSSPPLTAAVAGASAALTAAALAVADA